ncbi:MAG: immunoglobulin domain-containing protein [Verrucomicrobiota bacterium]
MFFEGARAKPLFTWLAALLSFSFLSSVGHAVIRDGGIDPSNLGRGSWIYIMPNATANLGGNVTAVTNLPSLMIYMKNQGLQYVIIKAAQGDTPYPSTANPQFTTAVVQAVHAAGLLVFGYIYSTGANVPGEVSMANFIFQKGADGLIYDAEVEWERNTSSSAVGTNGPALATQLCSTVRSNWPNKFMGLSTWPYRAVHSTLPYREFAYYCDVIMPQAYWIELGDTPTACVTRINLEWNTWKTGLTGKWTNAIKPFVVTGQGWSSASGTITPAQIGEFENALRTVSNPASPGGYKSVDYWRAELHPSSIWTAIRTNFLRNPYTDAPLIQFPPTSTIGATTASISWPTDQSSTGVVEFGLSAGYGTATTNAAAVWYHTVNLSGLSPNTTYHYRVKSEGTNNLTSTSGDFVFTTATAAVADIVIDQDPANNSSGNSLAYVGTWTTGVVGSAYLGTFAYASPTYGLGTPTLRAKFLPAIVTPGNYNVYASWASSAAGGNRATNAPFRIYSNGTVTTTRVNEEANGNSFQLIGSAKFFQAGTTDYIEAGNDVTLGAGGDIVIADAVKLVFLPPPPTAPAIASQPVSQTVNEGNVASFMVSAGGTAPLIYQWKFQGTNIPGATNSLFTRENSQPSDAGNYSVSISNSFGSANSASASLTVNQFPSITAAPVDATRMVGSSVTFSVGATGTAPLSYQWKFNDVNIEGETGTTYSRANLQGSDSGIYSVTVSNVAGMVSASATLSVIPPTPPEITSIQILADGTARLQVVGEPGTYFVDWTLDLAHWTPFDAVTNSSGSIEFIDPATNQPLRFYRARSSP